MALLVKWNGAKRKIDAIKVVRQVFGLGLKEAKDVVDNREAGFLCTQLQWLALRGLYMTDAQSPRGDKYVNDWMVETYQRRLTPTDLSDNEPYNDLPVYPPNAIREFFDGEDV